MWPHRNDRAVCLFCNSSVTAAWKSSADLWLNFQFATPMKDCSIVFMRMFCFQLSAEKKQEQKKKKRDTVAICMTASDDGHCWHSWYAEMRRLGCDHTDWSDVIGMLTKNMWRYCRATIILNASLPAKRSKETNHSRASLPAISNHPLTLLTHSPPPHTCQQTSTRKCLHVDKAPWQTLSKRKYEKKRFSCHEITASVIWAESVRLQGRVIMFWPFFVSVLVFLTGRAKVEWLP